MTYTTLRREEIISAIRNWVCPECGGRIGGRTKEFKCQGECQRDWRQVWENSRVTKRGSKHALAAGSRQALHDHATNGIDFRLDGGIPRITQSNIYLTSPQGRSRLTFVGSCLPPESRQFRG